MARSSLPCQSKMWRQKQPKKCPGREQRQYWKDLRPYGMSISTMKSLACKGSYKS